MNNILIKYRESLCVSAPPRENVFDLFSHPIGFDWPILPRIKVFSVGR
jgi:hypothetical protein